MEIVGQSSAQNVGVERNVVNPNPHEFVPIYTQHGGTDTLRALHVGVPF